MNRRDILAGTLIFAATGLSPAVVLGHDGHDNDNDNDNDNDRESRPPQVRTVYTQDQFLRLDHATVKWVRLNSQGGNYNRVTGFTRAMWRALFTMAENDRSSAFGLVRAMQSLNTQAERRGRLQTEIERIDKLEKDAEASANRLGLRQLRYYSRGVKIWLNDPMEGAK